MSHTASEEFQLAWRAARALENEGRPDEAFGIYSNLIEEDPGRLYVRLRLSALEEFYGHFNAARDHAVLAADAVRGGRFRDLAVVVRRLLTFDESLLAHDLILDADWSNPDILRTSHMLSQYLWLTGRIDESLRLIDVAEKRALPSCALAYSKANALRYRGDTDAATLEFERCLELDPGYPAAHWSLAYHKRAKVPGQRIPRITAAARGIQPLDPDQVFLDYALFKEHDDIGDAEGAWRHLMKGAAMKRASVDYDGVAEDEAFRAVARHLNDACHQDAGSSPRAFRPVFIVGMPRTGTTLLDRILSNTEGVKSGGELEDFRTSLSMVSDQFLGTQLRPELVDRLESVDMMAVGDLYRARVSRRFGDQSVVIDKNPANFAYASYVAKALPEAKIICLRRNPLDACFSNLKELFPSQAYGYSYELTELADHYGRFYGLSNCLAEALPDQFLVVDYEELVTDTERVTERLAAFCGIGFTPEMIDITRNRAPVATASSSQVREPINRRGIGAWRKYSIQLEPLRERLIMRLDPGALARLDV